jgi:hypothetical protein
MNVVNLKKTKKKKTKNAVSHMVSYDLKIFRQEGHTEFFLIRKGKIISASSHSSSAV